MTSRAPRTSGTRLSFAALVGLLVATSLTLLGAALSADDGGRAAVRATAPTASTSTTTTAAEPATTAPRPPALADRSVEPVDLPVPEDAPVDAHADTPYVVHGTLSLPSIGMSQPLHEGVTLTAINHGPSHWPGTAMPGQAGNVVVAGHRTTYSRPFHDLDLLAPGDPLVFTMNDGTVWTYELTGTSVVGPDAMHIVMQSPERTATLFACHPKGSAAQRIVAHFRLVTPPA
jgi:sortase A